MVGDLRPGLLGLHEVGHEVVPALPVGLLHEAQALLPVLHQVVGVRDLLLVGEIPPGHGAAGVRPPLERVDLVDVLAEEGQDRDGRHVVGQVPDEVARAVLTIEHPLEEAGHVVPDERFERLVAARGERLLHDAADPGVLRRHAGGEPRVGGEPALLHDPPGHGTAFAHRRLGVLGAEGLPVPEDGLDVLVAGHHPVADPLVVHDRLLGPEGPVGREGVVLPEGLVAVVGHGAPGGRGGRLVLCGGHRCSFETGRAVDHQHGR